METHREAERQAQSEKETRQEISARDAAARTMRARRRVDGAARKLIFARDAWRKRHSMLPLDGAVRRCAALIVNYGAVTTGSTAMLNDDVAMSSRFDDLRPSLAARPPRPPPALQPLVIDGSGDAIRPANRSLVHPPAVAAARFSPAVLPRAMIDLLGR